MTFTVKICKQIEMLNSKTKPILYKVEEPNFQSMATDELNHLYLEAQSIMTRVQTMLQARG